MKTSSLFVLALVASPVFGQSLTKEEIQKVVRSNTDQIRSCYEKATKRTPGVVGKLRVEIKVDKDGHVVAAKALDSTFQGPGPESCMESKIKRWHFPAPGPSDITTFSYPFAFGKEGEPPAPASPTVIANDDARMYKGRAFKRSNRPVTDVAKMQEMTENPLVKAIASGCDNIQSLKAKCEGLDVKDRVVCSAMTDSAPKKPFTPDWLLVDHPAAFRIESGTYFMGYWHISCGELAKI